MPASSRRCISGRGLAAVVVAIAAAVTVRATPRVADSPLIGSWRQSAWKLCKPVPQMSMADIDPPIEDLAFREDGTFSVMWQGGGAHTTDIPHVFVPVPDYRGHFTVDPAAGRIRMRVDNGLYLPRDFSGDGAYTVRGDQLVLTGIWLGTKQAPRKPDICELTFTRK